MSGPTHRNLSRREREIMDLFYRLGEATAGEIFAAMENPPTDTSVRKLVRILEGKGHLTHDPRGREFVYRPTVPHSEASRAAVQHLVETFFQGSTPLAVAALLNATQERLSAEDAARLTALVDEAARVVPPEPEPAPAPAEPLDPLDPIDPIGPGGIPSPDYS